MRKIAWVCTLVTVLLMTSSCGLLNGLFHKTSYLEVVEERLGLSLDEAKVLEEWDTHGGFHGDGEAFVKVSVSDGFEGDLGLVEIAEGKFDDGWYALPLMGTAYEYFYEWGGLFEHPETGERVIPEVENGYWKMTGSAPQNWEIVILDTDADTLYYYEYDS